jgi:CRP/FNR family transcriptional regulator, cyclic AMP receptor protein
MTVSGKTRLFQPEAFLAKFQFGSRRATFRRGQKIYSQGDPANAVFYIHEGKIHLEALSRQYKEEIIGVLGVGDFFGEGCLTGQSQRMGSAVAGSECVARRIEKSAMLAVLRQQPALSDLFILHLLNRNIPIERALVDQLFSPSEKRLARLLLLLANFGQEEEEKRAPLVANVSQINLAEMFGTKRSLIQLSMNKFRNLGFIEYNDDRLIVHSSLLNVILHD